MGDKWSEHWADYTKKDLLDIYGASRRKALVKAYRKLFISICDDKHLRVLDAGCGFGELFESLPVDSRKNYVGIDASKYCIDECNSRFNSPGCFSIHDLTDPIIGEFDCIFSLTVLEHVRDKQLALTNIRKALSKDGLLYVEVRNYRYLLKRFPKPVLLLLQKFNVLDDQYPDSNFRDLTIEEWQAVILEAGFEIIACKKSIRPFFRDKILGTVKNLFIYIIKITLPIDYNYMVAFHIKKPTADLTSWRLADGEN